MFGIPLAKAGFCVLCLHTTMPKRAPEEPPAAAINSNVFSGMRQELLTAYFLSSQNMKKVIKLNNAITIKVANMLSEYMG